MKRLKTLYLLHCCITLPKSHYLFILWSSKWKLKIFHIFVSFIAVLIVQATTLAWCKEGMIYFKFMLEWRYNLVFLLEFTTKGVNTEIFTASATSWQCNRIEMNSMIELSQWNTYSEGFVSHKLKNN